MSVSELEGVPVVRIEGELDAESAPEFQQRLKDVTGGEETEDREVIIDLQACTYIDSAGLGALFSLASWARQKGGWVAAARPPVQVLRILQLVRLTDERGFQVFSDLESARAALHPA